DAGQRRAGRLGDDLPVVEADQGDILRDGNPALAERIGNAARDLVVATEDRIGRVTPRPEEAPYRLAAPRLRPGAGKVEAVNVRAPGPLKRPGVALPAEADGLEALGPGDMGDALAAEFDQMLDGKHRAALVVGHEAVFIGVVDQRIDVEHRNPRRRHDQLRTQVGAAAGHHDAVDALADQRFDMLRLTHRIVGGVAHEDRHAAVGEAFLQPLHDRNRETAETVGRDQADGEAVAAMQALGEAVRAETEALGDFRDAGPGLLPEAAAVVERLRHGRDADIGGAGNIVNRRTCRFAVPAGPAGSVDAPRHRYFTAPLRKPDT